jgi:hypothetical protein
MRSLTACSMSRKAAAAAAYHRAPGWDGSVRRQFTRHRRSNPLTSGAAIEVIANGASPTADVFLLPPGLRWPVLPGGRHSATP